MSGERQFPVGSRVEDLDLSGVRLHGANFDGAKLTDTSLVGADISGDIEGTRINGVEIEPLVQAELDRVYPGRVAMRSSDVSGLQNAWSTLEHMWAETTARALRLPEALQGQGVNGEWSVVETLRHLVFATDCWLRRAILLEPHPYHPWGLPWSGAGRDFAQSIGIDLEASPSLKEILPLRQRQQVEVRKLLERLTDKDLSQIRTAPHEPGHPSGDHSILGAIHVILNEEWEHHRYVVRDLGILDSPSGTPLT